MKLQDYLNKKYTKEQINNLTIIDGTADPEDMVDVITDLYLDSPLPKVKSLLLFGSDISNLIGIEKLPNLEILDIPHTQISNIKDVSKLNKLTKFHLYGNGYLTSITDELKNIKSLELLNMEELNIADISNIKLPSSLRILYLGGELKNVKDLSFISNCVNLEILDVGDMGINSIRGTENMTKLKKFNCASNEITSIDALEKCINISDLKCHYNLIRDLSVISNFKYLEEFLYHQNNLPYNYPMDKDDAIKYEYIKYTDTLIKKHM